MSKVDISSEAVERDEILEDLDKWAEETGDVLLLATAKLIRAQAERIKELEDGMHVLVGERDRALSAIPKARNDALREAASVAANACLVEPDGGSPTKAEADVCEEAYRRIIALISEDSHE